MAMMRDASAIALANVPLTLIVKRPDGSEFTRFSQALPGGGALHQAIALPKSSRRGRWSVAAHVDPKAPPVGSVEFSVEDFVPEKLKVELSQPASPAPRSTPSTCRPTSSTAPASASRQRPHRITVDAQPFPTAAAPLKQQPGASVQPPFVTLRRETDARARPLDGPAHQDTVLRAWSGRVFGRPADVPRAPRRPCRCAAAASISASARPRGRYSRRRGPGSIVAVGAPASRSRSRRSVKIERTDCTYKWYRSTDAGAGSRFPTTGC
jgi:hypothetical protein